MLTVVFWMEVKFLDNLNASLMVLVDLARRMLIALRVRPTVDPMEDAMIAVLHPILNVVPPMVVKLETNLTAIPVMEFV